MFVVNIGTKLYGVSYYKTGILIVTFVRIQNLTCLQGYYYLRSSDGRCVIKSNKVCFSFEHEG